MTVADWMATAAELRAAGLDALADFYQANARRAQAGERPLWPPPPEIRASSHLAGKPEPAPFAGDAREP